MMTSKYRHDGLRDLGLGDAVMVSKERQRKHVNELDLETFPKSWIGRDFKKSITRVMQWMGTWMPVLVLRLLWAVKSTSLLQR